MSESCVLTIRVSPELKSSIEKQAMDKHITASDLVRQYIDKGISLDGYKQEIDYLTDITKSSLKDILSPQIERLIKVLMKIGKINGAGYYIQLANLMNADDKTNLNTVSQTVQKCNKLAIKYMSQKDSDVERFLEDNQELLKQALSLKDNSYGFMYDFNDGDLQ